MDGDKSKDETRSSSSYKVKKRRRPFRKCIDLEFTTEADKQHFESLFFTTRAKYGFNKKPTKDFFMFMLNELNQKPVDSKLVNEYPVPVKLVEKKQSLPENKTLKKAPESERPGIFQQFAIKKCSDITP